MPLSFDGIFADRVEEVFLLLFLGAQALFVLVEPAAQSSGLLGSQIQGLVLLALQKRLCFSQAKKHKSQSKIHLQARMCHVLESKMFCVRVHCKHKNSGMAASGCINASEHHTVITLTKTLQHVTEQRVTQEKFLNVILAHVKASQLLYPVLM